MEVFQGGSKGVMDVQNSIDDYYSQENVRCHGNGMNIEGSNMDILTRVELEVPFASEKLLNLEMLVMEIARMATDFEPPILEDESVSSETAKSAFELDILYGIRDAEVRELDEMITSLQNDIQNVEHKVYEDESGGKIKAKLDAAMVSLNQMKDLISDIRKESAKFEKAIEFSRDEEGITEDSGYENGIMSSHTSMQTESQRRNVLHMLEQSIASELDLEKKLSESRFIIEELKMKLHHHDQEKYFLEESIESLCGRAYAAENASEILFGTSKELVDRISNIQFQLSASRFREDDMKSKLKESLIRLSLLQEESQQSGATETAYSLTHPSPEFLSLQDKVKDLKKQLSESDSQLELAKASAQAFQEEQNVLHSKISTLENTIKSLKDDVSRAESRAQNAEVRCMQLTEANVELNGELSSLKSHDSDKASLLERKLKESNTQLEHAKASVDAIVEQQSMLRSTMSDMENMIDDLKGKVLKAETRAQNAESKCTSLTDTNLELSEELSFLRGRVESLENSLHEANHVKMSTVKDIGMRTKVITDLVTKLALERERLHHQISLLTKKNKILAQKSKGSVKDGTPLSKNVTGKDAELHSTKLAQEIVPDFSSSQTKVQKSVDPINEEDKTSSSEDDNSAGEGIPEAVRTIQPSVLNWKYITLALLILLVAVFIYLPLPEESSLV
ncbi:WPP domain-interacting tail-anchored protein 1-like isoform X1 [Oryza brachyantha]|uniref:WPP domain-interacting tail-anchored protein 1-like isoform X1 n=1 Tax=Oryza brachyantha TaxID=4533 RepID=UPI0007761334|nr:WPP domain-interacting tail-anchored protein 1-like isoform X1 [Oryza brachyantha]